MIKLLQPTKAFIAGTVCLASALSAWSAAPTLYGVKSYSQEITSNGIFSVEAVEGAQPQFVWGNGDMIPNGGAVYCDGTLYVLSYFSIYGNVYWGYEICDVENETYEYLFLENLDLVTTVAGTTGYDPTSSTAYAVCLADNTGENFNLCTIDLPTAKKTPVAPLPQRIFTLAFTATGQLYGIGADGILYKINKYNGALTEVGATGIIPRVNECAVIDYETNIMYWHSTPEEDKGCIYTVDLETGNAELLTQFSPSYQLYGLFIKQKAQVGNAPAAPENLVAEFDGAALNGFLNFTLPTLDIDGGQLIGDIDWKVTLDGEELSSGSGAPGTEVAAPIVTPTSGIFRFVAEVSCAGHNGMSSNLQLWVGMDTPCAVTDIEISADAHTVTLDWVLPERGINGGYVDHSKTRYIIDRGPEDVTIFDNYDKTTFTETLEGRSGTYPVLYRITPYVDDLYGEPVISTYVRAGEPFVPPFTIDLTDPFNSLIFDFIDRNHDGATWYYDLDKNVMSCMWPISDDRCRDDWMVSSPISLEAGKYYTLSINIRSEGIWSYEDQMYFDIFAGELAAYLSKTPRATGMTKNLLEKEDVESIEWYTRTSEPFSVDESGIYYIGLHVTGTREVRNIYNILLNSLKVETHSSVSVNENDYGFSATAGEGVIMISNPNGAHVRIFTPSGAQVAATNDVSATISLHSGIYIATCENQSVKLVVR